MRRALAAVLALPLLLALAACAPAVHQGALPPKTHHTPASTAPATNTATTPTPTPTPTPTLPPVINKADYLVDGTPGKPDANGEWYGEYAFFTDSTKSVFCQITIFSGDNPANTCSIVPSARAQATYALPPNSSPNCVKSDWDGYTLGLGAAVEDLLPKDAGFDQCWNPTSIETPAIVAKTKVLPDGATLTVSPFTCTVSAGVATCKEVVSGLTPPSITMGLHVATFVAT